jgi:hypothetical protein
MTKKTFKTRLESTDRGAVRLILPFDPTEVWGTTVRHVKGSLNGTPFEGSIGARDGKRFVPVNKELRVLAKVEAGDTVSVVLEPAQASSQELPADLDRALRASKKAHTFFDGLSAFYRNTYVGWITGAKKPETRAERVKKTVELLDAGKKQR